MADIRKRHLIGHEWSTSQKHLVPDSKYLKSLESQERLRHNTLWNSVKDATAIIPQRNAPEHLHVEMAARLAIQRIYAWLQLNAEIAEVHID